MLAFRTHPSSCFCIIIVAIQLARSTSSFSIPDPLIHFGIGAIAGGCGAIAYQPFDYIKAQIQSDAGGQRYHNNGFRCCVETIQTNPRAFFKGMTASVTGVAPEKSLKLGVNDVLRDGFRNYNGFVEGVLPLWSQVLSGAVAGACQVLVSSPLDVIKIRMQTRSEEDGPEQPSLRQLLQEVGGPKGLYRGAGACLLRDVSFTAVCFPLYSYLLGNGMDAFSAGALSGVVSTFIATPFDMIKTRILTSNNIVCNTPPVLQTVVQSGVPVFATVGGNSTVTSFGLQRDYAPMPDTSRELAFQSKVTEGDNPFQIAKMIVRQEGLGVLFTGVYERCGGAIPRFGITLGIHEWLERYASTIGMFS